MYRLVRNLLGGALLIAFAAGSWWLGRPLPERAEPAANGSVPLGFYLEDADIMGTNEDGQLVYRIRATRAEERPGEDALDLRDVRVEYQPAAGVSWSLTAANGVVPKDRSFLELHGDVRLESVPGDGKRHVEVQLERLEIDADTLVARSDDTVRIAIDGHTLRARGLEAHLKDDRLRLESDIHAELAP